MTDKPDRAWKQTGRPVPARTVNDARVIDAIRDVCRTSAPDERRRLTHGVRAAKTPA